MNRSDTCKPSARDRARYDAYCEVEAVERGRMRRGDKGRKPAERRQDDAFTAYMISIGR